MYRTSKSIVDSLVENETISVVIAPALNNHVAAKSALYPATAFGQAKACPFIDS